MRHDPAGAAIVIMMRSLKMVTPNRYLRRLLYLAARRAEGTPLA